jgi:hypothetical protein
MKCAPCVISSVIDQRLQRHTAMRTLCRTPGESPRRWTGALDVLSQVTRLRRSPGFPDRPRATRLTIARARDHKILESRVMEFQTRGRTGVRNRTSAARCGWIQAVRFKCKDRLQRGFYGHSVRNFVNYARSPRVKPVGNARKVSASGKRRREFAQGDQSSSPRTSSGQPSKAPTERHVGSPVWRNRVHGTRVNGTP